MCKLNRMLVALLVVLLFVAGAGGIVAVDSDSSALGVSDGGSGSVSDDDGSPMEDYVYGGNSNVGSADSVDDGDSVDDPLDEDYYSSSSSSSNGDDGGVFSVRLTNHATGNPLFVLLLSSISLIAFGFKRIF